ncbi:MAG: O-antigen ligase family protein, partial [Pirellulaceae bacterium]|nr:O-antigen ligase family protein [Pirellulaceae bacterium]
MAIVHRNAADTRRKHGHAGPSGRIHRHPPRAAARLDTLLGRVIDGGLASCLLVVPFLMGGRHPIGQAVLVAAVAATVVAWALRQAAAGEGWWRPTLASLLLPAAVLLVAAQLAPLPHDWLARLSPRTVELLTLWGPDADSTVSLGEWSRLSLTPAETRAGLILLVSYGLLFLVTVQRVQGVEDIERILRWCALAAVAMALFGLVQYLAGNGKFFWFHDSPYSTTDGVVKGSFTNRNHFAHFMALGIGPLVWWLHAWYRRERPDASSGAAVRRYSHEPVAWCTPQNAVRLLPCVALALVVIASLLSLSRGGNTSLFLAATIAMVVCGRAAAVGGRFLLGAGFAGVLIVGTLNIFGAEYDKVSNRLGDLSSGSIEQVDQLAARRTIWTNTLAAISDFSLLGSGVGSFREVYPVYDESPANGTFASHAENGPLQIALETGAFGTVLLACGIGFCAFWCVAGIRSSRSVRLQSCLGAIAASLAASLVHSMVDFVWYVPGCMAVAAVFAGLACRAWQLTRPADRPVRVWRLSPTAAVAVAILVAVMSIGMVHNRFRAGIAEHFLERSRIAIRDGAKRLSASQDLASAEYRQSQVELQKEILADLDRAVAWHPEHARARMELAECHLRLFDLNQLTAANPMPLGQIRDAAIASQEFFSSRKERDEWMRRAFGEHCEHLHLALRHARRALRGSPLLGEGYVFLAGIGFLDRAKPESKWAYLDQAIRVRPRDGQVWAAAARETLESVNAGDLGPWLRFARKVLESGTRGQKVEFFEGPLRHVPPEGVGPVLDFYAAELQPDAATLGSLYAIGRKRGSAEQLARFQTHYAAAAESEAARTDGREASRLWSTAAAVHVDRGDAAEAI